MNFGRRSWQGAWNGGTSPSCYTADKRQALCRVLRLMLDLDSVMDASRLEESEILTSGDEINKLLETIRAGHKGSMDMSWVVWSMNSFIRLTLRQPLTPTRNWTNPSCSGFPRVRKSLGRVRDRRRGKCQASTRGGGQEPDL